MRGKTFLKLALGRTRVRDRPGSQGASRRRKTAGSSVTDRCRSPRLPDALADGVSRAWYAARIELIESNPLSGCWRSRSTSAGGREPWESRRSGAPELAARPVEESAYLVRPAGSADAQEHRGAGRRGRSRRRAVVGALRSGGRPDVPVATSLERLLASEAVPFWQRYRYKDSGLRKRPLGSPLGTCSGARTPGPTTPPPRITAATGRSRCRRSTRPRTSERPEYWSHRGKLDVPKERFILYPGAGREGDPTPVLGWAGWDHAQQALALATLIQSGEQQGWSEDRLIPLVAGLSELLPWVEQWHSEPDALYGGSSPAEFFSGLLDNYMAKLGATRESLAAWRPPAPTRGRKAKS